MLSNKKLNTIVTTLCNIGRKPYLKNLILNLIFLCLKILD